jgi:hypothetical protein
VPAEATAVEQVARCIERGYDVFFNLCDGAADQQDTPGIEVVRTLERHGVAFTGATSEFYEPSREAMKRACRAEGIAVPEYVLARGEADVERAGAGSPTRCSSSTTAAIRASISRATRASCRRRGSPGRRARSSAGTAPR